jgi:hypothetical protein
VNGQHVRDRERDATTGAALVHTAAGKLDEAGGAVRRQEAELETTFELVRDAERAALEAGLQVKVGMSPVMSAAYHAWANGDHADQLPAVLR